MYGKFNNELVQPSQALASTYASTSIICFESFARQSRWSRELAYKPITRCFCKLVVDDKFEFVNFDLNKQYE